MPALRPVCVSPVAIYAGDQPMNDREFKQQQVRIQKAMARWKEILPLGRWDITPEYFREPWQERSGVPSSAVAETYADWRYLHASIRWNTPKILDSSDGELTMYVIHELMHCLIDELTEYATGTGAGDGMRADMGQIEQTTTELTLAIQWAYAAGLKARKD